MTRGARLLAVALSQIDKTDTMIARDLNLSKSQLSHYLTGRSRPKLDKAAELEDRYRIPIRAWTQRV